jgi:glycosyltransferase involved in cell wall biosynthesis
MKILLLADSDHTNTLNWAQHMASPLGHEVHVASFHAASRTVEGLHLHSLEGGRTGKGAFLLGAGAAGSLVERLRPDLLIGYRLTSYAYLAARTGFHPLVVAAQSQRAAGWKWGLRKPVQWLAAIHAVKKADLVLVWADHMRDDVLRLGAAKGKIVNIPRGVRLELFPFRPKPPSPESYTIITTRGLMKTYDLHLAIEAVAALRDRIDGIRLLMAGDGPYRESLEALVRERDVEDLVEFTGRVEYTALKDHLARADLYLSTVPEDGVSSSLLEAMASGVRPLTTDIHANRMWEDRGCRISFFRPGDAGDLARRIEECRHLRSGSRQDLQGNRSIVEQEACWDTNLQAIDAKLTSL